MLGTTRKIINDRKGYNDIQRIYIVITIVKERVM